MEATANLLHLSIAIIGALLVELFFGWSKLYYRIRRPGEGTHQAQAALSPASSLDSDACLRRRSVEVPTDESLPVQGSPHTDKSLSNHEWKYHVFLSFRGEDTRFKFTDHLYGALCRAGINTFRDQEELRTGDKIRPALLNAIEDSRISIIVLSKNYAYSSWCLDELVKILECRKLMNQVVLPIFYEVNPSEVRHQLGSFGDSMARHEKRFKDNIEKVEKWRSALRKVANLSGESYTKESEYEFIDKIIQKISIILNHPLLHFPEQVFGLESRKSIVLSLLSIEPNDLDVSMVGIYGTGGVGKTTIAKAVYNSIAAQFESTSFYSDVRENTTKHGLAHVQRSILVDMLGNNDINLHNTHRGSVVMKERLQNKRVLLVLDDVDKLKQLQSLAGGCDWFGPGSRVIITTRDKQLLIRHGVEQRYKVQELDKKEALNLLCWNAFRSKKPKSGFEDVSTRVLSYARGIPLALEIIGAHLFGKDVEEWESAMDAYQKNMDSEIFSILKVSYESLEYNEKEIFLDVACFLRGESIDYVEEILGGCGFSSKSGLSILEDRCLVKTKNRGVWMHDLTQRMGREIVRRESEREPWKRSRIWFHEDALKVLTRDIGTGKIEGLVLELPREKEVVWSGKAFEKMVNLRILIIRNAIFSKAPKELPNNLRVLEWENYPSSSLPSNFHGNELLKLQLKNATQIVEIQEPFKKFQNITRLFIEDCDRLKEVPDASAVPNLTSLSILRCRSLVKIHDSLGSLDNLKSLMLSHCPAVNEIPAWNQFKSLLDLHIFCCKKLGFAPIGGMQTTLEDIALYDVGIDFQSDYGSSLIQEMMDHRYSRIYHFPGSRMPRCFFYRSNQNSISFWIQKIFPDVHVGASLKGYNPVDQNLSLGLSIGPLQTYHALFCLKNEPTTHIFLLSQLLPLELCRAYRIIHENWVRVDIRVTYPDNLLARSDRNDDSDALECGVYVNPTCDANFSFIDPYSQYSIKNKNSAERLAENGVLPLTIVEQKDAAFSSADLLWKKIISLNVPFQVKHFAWTAISDHLTSKSSREEKGDLNGCHICGKRNVKTDFHFLKNCEWARGVWLLSPLGLRVARMEAENLSEWMQKLDRIFDTEGMELFLVIAWGLWSEWDKLCMGLKIEDPPSLIRRMCVLLQDYRINHRPMDQYMLTDADVASYRPLSQPACRQDGDQPCQKKNEKFEWPICKQIVRNFFFRPDEDL